MRAVVLLALAACGASAVPRYTGAITDIHAHLPDTAAELDRLRALDQTAGVTRSALIVMAKAGDIAATRKQNDGVIATARASAGWFFPICSVHPADGKDALAELERLAAAGVRVIKLHPNSQNFDVAAPEVAAVVTKAAELHLVLLFDGFSPFDANETGKFLRLAIEHPKARMIIAHLGGPRFAEFGVFAMVKQFPWWPNNLWFDLSATSHFVVGSPFAEQLVWLVRKLGIDHVVFGSDFPVDEPAHAVDDYRRLGFTAAEQQQIFHDNIEKLLR